MKKIIVILLLLFLSVPCVSASESSTEAILQYNQGIDYYKLGQYDSAICSFRAAIRLNPNYIDAYYNLGSVLEYLQQYDAALAVFKQIIVRKPEDYDSVYKAAWLSAKLGDIQHAKTYLKIIPANCARGKDARELASQLDVELAEKRQTQSLPAVPVTKPVTVSSEPTAEAATPVAKPVQHKNGVSQASGLFQNIPAPTGITSDSDGNIYVAEFNTNSIVRITPENKKELYIKSPKISGPIGLARDSYGNMYIANYNKDNVLKVSEYGEISVLISNVKKPYYLHIDRKVLLISCQGSNSVLKYKLP